MQVADGGEACTRHGTTVSSHTTSHNSPNLASCDIETRGDDRQREDAYATEYGNGTSGSEYDVPLSDKLSIARMRVDATLPARQRPLASLFPAILIGLIIA